MPLTVFLLSRPDQWDAGAPLGCCPGGAGDLEGNWRGRCVCGGGCVH